jgi:hypothetical protein
MKNMFITVLFFLTFLLVMNCYAQNKKTKNKVMKRYVVERSFPEGLNIPMDEKGCSIVQGVISKNTDAHVIWIQSYVSADKKKTFCIYEAPSPKAIRKAAKENNTPVDKITEINVLNPYFFTNK